MKLKDGSTKSLLTSFQMINEGRGVNVFTKNILRHLKGVLWTATGVIKDGYHLVEEMVDGKMVKRGHLDGDIFKLLQWFLSKSDVKRELRLAMNPKYGTNRVNVILSFDGASMANQMPFEVLTGKIAELRDQTGDPYNVLPLGIGLHTETRAKLLDMLKRFEGLPSSIEASKIKYELLYWVCMDLKAWMAGLSLQSGGRFPCPVCKSPDEDEASASWDRNDPSKRSRVQPLPARNNERQRKEAASKAFIAVASREPAGTATQARAAYDAELQQTVYINPAGPGTPARSLVPPSPGTGLGAGGLVGLATPAFRQPDPMTPTTSVREPREDLDSAADAMRAFGSQFMNGPEAVETPDPEVSTVEYATDHVLIEGEIGPSPPPPLHPALVRRYAPLCAILTGG